MAIRLKIPQISEDHLKFIVGTLNIKPKAKYVPSQMKFRPYTVKTEDPLKFYRTEDDEIIIPYNFGVNLIRGNPNYAKRYPLVDINFTKSLLSKQEDKANEALVQLRTYCTTLLKLYTGFGKTVVASWLLTNVKGLSLVLITSTTLISAWKNTFAEFTDAVVWVVGEKMPDNPTVIVCMNGRFESLYTNHKEYCMLIQNLVIDEYHTFCTRENVLPLLGLEPKYIIGCTATFERDDDMHIMAELMIGTHFVEEISSKPFNVIKYNTNIPIILPDNTGSFWTDYKKYQYTSVERNAIILDLVYKNYQANKILVLTWSVEHAECLADWIQKMGISCDYMAGTKKTYIDSNVLVGTISKIGTGFDERTVCETFNGFRLNLLILVGTMKKTQLLEQVAGRVFRADYPQIIHFVDDHAVANSHWKESDGWYRSRNGQIYEFNRSGVPETLAWLQTITGTTPLPPLQEENEPVTAPSSSFDFDFDNPTGVGSSNGGSSGVPNVVVNDFQKTISYDFTIDPGSVAQILHDTIKDEPVYEPKIKGSRGRGGSRGGRGGRGGRGKFESREDRMISELHRVTTNDEDSANFFNNLIGSGMV